MRSAVPLSLVAALSMCACVAEVSQPSSSSSGGSEVTAAGSSGTVSSGASSSASSSATSSGASSSTGSGSSTSSGSGSSGSSGASSVSSGSTASAASSGSSGSSGGTSGSTGSVSADFFVATNGNDTWSGTLPAPNAQRTDGPFATLARAQAAVRAIDKSARSSPIVVAIRGGTYALSSTLAFTSADSGTASAPVIYEAYPSETPILSGGIQIAGWTHGSGSTFTATVPSGDYFEQLWVNGERRYRPRANAGHYLRIAGKSTTSPLDTFQMVNATDLDESWHDLNDVELVVFEQWTVSRMRLLSVDAANKTATTTPFTSSASYHGFIVNHRYLAENVKEALGSPGDWYLERSTGQLTYIAEPGEDPTAGTAVTAPVLSQILTTDALAYTTFKGLTFSYTNWVVPTNGYPAGQSLWNIPAAVLVQKPLHVKFDGCTISHVGNNGIDFQGNSSGWSATASDPYSAEFVNGAIYDTGAGGIRIASSSGGSASTPAQGIHIANNVLSGGGRFLNSAQGILVGESHDDVIEHNEISDFYQTAIAVGFCFAQGPNGSTATYPTSHDDNNIIQYNLIHDIGRGVTSDMGGIYTITCDTQGNVIRNNVIHDVVNDPGGNAFAAGYGANGIYLDQGTSNIEVTDNLVYRVTGNAFQENFGRADHVHNNIFAFSRTNQIEHTFYETPSTLWLTYDHNIALFDHGGVFGNGWTCPASDCNPFADLHDNLYWNAADGGTVKFNLKTPASSLTLSQWQSAENEDPRSQVSNPQFASPEPPADDFSLPAGSPALALGFTPFDPTQAGRTSSTLQPPPVPAAAPLQEPADPTTFY